MRVKREGGPELISLQILMARYSLYINSFLIQFVSFQIGFETTYRNAHSAIC